MVPAMKDSRGRESKTLTFVSSAFSVLLVKFAMAGHYNFPPMTAAEFGSAVALILGIWLGREWTEKRK